MEATTVQIAKILINFFDEMMKQERAIDSAFLFNSNDSTKKNISEAKGKQATLLVMALNDIEEIFKEKK